MNKELYCLYTEYLKNLGEKLNNCTKGCENGVKPTNPLLINLENEEKYKEADIKVMIFGQETYDWEGNFGDRSIEELLSTYNSFFEQGECYKRGGNFWNAVKDFKNSLQEKYPNKKVEFVWNNILKIGKEGDKGAPSEEIINITQKEFPVIKNEIEILKPDVILFFTGPNYDVYINNIFSNTDFQQVSNWDTRYLAKVKGDRLPEKTFRTYHPRYLQSPSSTYVKENYPEFYTSIKETILSLI